MDEKYFEGLADLFDEKKVNIQKKVLDEYQKGAQEAIKTVKIEVGGVTKEGIDKFIHALQEKLDKVADKLPGGNSVHEFFKDVNKVFCQALSWICKELVAATKEVGNNINQSIQKNIKEISANALIGVCEVIVGSKTVDDLTKDIKKNVEKGIDDVKNTVPKELEDGKKRITDKAVDKILDKGGVDKKKFTEMLDAKRKESASHDKGRA